MIADILVLIFALLVGIAVLFPIPVRILFCGSKVNGFLELRLFRKKLFSTRAESVEKESAGKESGEIPESDFVLNDKAQDPGVEDFPFEQKFETAVRKSPTISPQKSETVSRKSSPHSEKNPAKKNAKSKGKSSDREFLTILIEPKFSGLVLKGSFRIAKAFFRIFHCRFETAVVDGIRTGQMDEMGYLFGGLNFLSGTIPFFENWEFGMDWEGNRPFRIEGCLCIRFSVARILGFGIVSLRWIFEWIARYFLNRRRYRKSPEAFRLIFWRRWIVRFLSPEPRN